MGGMRPFRRKMARAQGIPWGSWRRKPPAPSPLVRPVVAALQVVAAKPRGAVVRWLARLLVRILAPLIATLKRWRKP